MVMYQFAIYRNEKSSRAPRSNREKKFCFMTEYHELFSCEMKENRGALLEVVQQSLLKHKRAENIYFPPERC